MEFIRYTFVGMLSYVFVFISTIVLTEYFFIYYVISYAISRAIITLINFFLASHYIYNSNDTSYAVFIKYIISIFATYVFEISLLYIITEFINFDYKFSVITIGIVMYFFKYFIYGKYVFVNNNKKDRVTREKELHKKLAKFYEDEREGNIIGLYYSEYWLEKLIGLTYSDDNTKLILDVGCGTGISYETIKTNFKKVEYIGIDISPDMIAVGKKRNENMDLREMNCEALEFEDNKFDIVLARSILHHLPNPIVAYKEMTRVLKPGGIILLTEPHKTIISSIIRFFLKLFTGHFDPDHTHFSKKELVNLSDQAGAKIKQSRFFGYLAYPFCFPDILPLDKLVNINIVKKLCIIDEHISQMGLIKNQGFHLMIEATKE